MKIKRYFATDMRQAIRLVREEQGPDAVILSNRKVNGGVEIVAAIDYDEATVQCMANQVPAQTRPATPPPPEKPLCPTPVAEGTSRPQQARTADDVSAAPLRRPEKNLPPVRPVPAAHQQKARAPVEWLQDPLLQGMHNEIQTLRSMLETQLGGMAWRDQRLRHPARTRLLQRLLQLGLAPEVSRQLADKTVYEGDSAQHWRHALGLLARQLTVLDDDILGKGGVVALVGPTGVGKTTTVAKLAARYILRHGPGSVALVTTDSYRIGAHQQLRTYGRLLGIPVYLANDASELRSILDTLTDQSLVLIDTAGVSQRDIRLAEQLNLLQESDPALRSYLVLSAAAQRATLGESLRAFRHTSLAGCIITKLDETAGLGEVLSAVVQERLPLAYVCDGQRVPEDLHQARANKLVSNSVALLQQHGRESPPEEALVAAFGNPVY